jgi:hypothetical protein
MDPDTRQEEQSRHRAASRSSDARSRTPSPGRSSRSPSPSRASNASHYQSIANQSPRGSGSLTSSILLSASSSVLQSGNVALRPPVRVTTTKASRSGQKHHHIHTFEGNGQELGQYDLNDWSNQAYSTSLLAPTALVTADKVRGIIRGWSGDGSLADAFVDGLLIDANAPKPTWDDCQVSPDFFEQGQDDVANKKIVKHLLALKDNCEVREHDIDSQQNGIAAKDANCVSTLTLTETNKLRKSKTTIININWRNVLSDARKLLKGHLVAGEKAPNRQDVTLIEEAISRSTDAGIQTLLASEFLYKPELIEGKLSQKEQADFIQLASTKNRNASKQTKYEALTAKKDAWDEANAEAQQRSPYLYREKTVKNGITSTVENKTNPTSGLMFGMGHLNAILYDEWLTATDLLGLVRTPKS